MPPSALRRGVDAVARIAPGALFLAAFALPAVHGSGPLSGREFSALDLVHVVPGLASTRDAAWQAAALRLAAPFAVTVGVAAAWHLLLALLQPRHPLRAAAGAYLCAAALALAGIEIARGYAWPLAGVYVWLCAAALIAAPPLARLARLARTALRPARAHTIALTEFPAQRD